jgi:hypothetical protein
MHLFIPPRDAFAAPDQTVSGTVTDGGKPLSGATVSVKGGTRNTVTDAKGSFTISVPGAAVYWW